MAMNPVNLNGGHFSQLGVPIKRATSATPELAPGSGQSPEVPVNPVEAIQSTLVSLSASYKPGSNNHETTFDSEKVANAKKAIADGSYWNTHDSQRLAGKIIDLESLFA